jgi:NADPH:quinone reductase-like Zn-dependent oxidoreductase
LVPVKFPITLGWDFSGVVVEVGNDISEYAIGDAIYSRPEVSRDGSQAEYIAVPARDVAQKPETISHSAAASLPIASITAWQSLFDLGDLNAGQKVLIHAGAGSLGIIAIQLAKNKGAYVVATAQERNHDFVKSLGADEVVDYTKVEFQNVVGGMDVVLDTIGGQVQEHSYSVLNPGGVLVAVNTFPSMERASEMGVVAKFLSIKPNGTLLANISSIVESGHLRPVVGYEFGFENIYNA